MEGELEVGKFKQIIIRSLIKVQVTFNCVYKSKSDKYPKCYFIPGDRGEDVPDGVAVPAARPLLRRALRLHFWPRAQLLGDQEGAREELFSQVYLLWQEQIEFEYDANLITLIRQT